MLHTDQIQATPVLDVTPAARLPHCVTEHTLAAQPDADTAREHAEHTETAPMSALVAALPEFGLNNTELLYAEFTPDTNGADISLNSQGNGQLFTPAQADDFADKVIVWGRTVKAMAAAGRRHCAGADENEGDRAEQIERLVAALPDAVDESMRKAVPHLYTPQLAAKFTAAMTAELCRPTTPPQTPCPDAVAWCLGNPADHADPREHRHEGPEYGLTGSHAQGARNESLVAFRIVQWDDDAPRLVFQSDGTWPDLDLTQVDELIGDAVPWLTQLVATRRRLAIEVSPNRSTVPFTESEDEQMASGAFDLATKAMDIALAKSEDRAGTLRALRSFLDMTEAEQA